MVGRGRVPVKAARVKIVRCSGSCPGLMGHCGGLSGTIEPPLLYRPGAAIGRELVDVSSYEHMSE